MPNDDACLQPAATTVAIIVAMGLNREIGLRNKIPWRIPGEQQRFKTLTMGHHVVMGRRTFESIPRGLPGRHVLVLSRSPLPPSSEARRISSPREALDAVPPGQTLFVAGGATAYAAFLNMCDLLYLTVVQNVFEADTYFPEIDLHDFEVLQTDEVEASIPYVQKTLRRKAHGCVHVDGSLRSHSGTPILR
jgi:dihydrofolate reductase